MPGKDEMIILGGATLKKSVIDVYDSLAARARQKATAFVEGVKNRALSKCRRLAVTVKALQHIVE